MALFLPRGWMRPNLVRGRIAGHPQARSLVHWLPGLGSDPFTAGGGSPFIGAYLGVTDVAQPFAHPKEAFDLQKVTGAGLSGTVFHCADTANHQSAVVFVPQKVFKGAGQGGAGATLSMWVKLRVATPVTNNLTGLCSVHAIGSGMLNTHYTWTDGNIYCGVFRTGAGERKTVTPSALVDRTQWHLVTITDTGYVWRMYQNGILIHTDTSGDGNVYVGDSGSSYISLHGSWSEGSYFINGWSCDWRLYNRALTLAEVQALYHPATRWSLYYGV